jgi:trimeric autotransporter adhesin
MLVVLSVVAGSAVIPAVAPASTRSSSARAVRGDARGIVQSASATQGGRGWRSVPAAARGPILRALGRVDPAYRVRRAAGGVTAVSRVQGLRAHFGAAGVWVRSGSSDFRLRVSAVGLGDRLTGIGASKPVASGNRVTYPRAGLSEWYANGPMGLEQGFTVMRPGVRGAGPLTLSMTLSGNLRGSLTAGAHGLVLSRGRRPVLAYRDLVATDVRGRALRSWLVLNRGRLQIRVDTRGAGFPVRIDPVVQQARLTASDGAAYDGLGGSVAVSSDGSTVVAGAPAATVAGMSNQGAVYMFVKPAGGWASDTQAAKLIASDGAQYDQLGRSVAVSSDGSTVVAGAAQNATYRGAAYVFVRPAGGWASGTETAKLTGSDSAQYDQLGYSVAMSSDGSTVVAGAWLAGAGSQLNDGAAYVFVKPAGGWASGTEAAKLTASDGAQYDRFGYSVAVSSDGSTVVAGAYAATVGGDSWGGAVYAFVKPVGGWVSGTEAAKLTASDVAQYDGFGYVVGVSSDGSTVVAAAYTATVGGNSSQGAAYVFVKPLGGWTSGTEAAKLTASDGAAGDYLGQGVAVSSDGSTVVAGAPGATVGGASGPQGAAYTFIKPAGGWATGTETTKLTASDGAPYDHLGLVVAVSASGSTVIAGAPSVTVGGQTSEGAAYVFGSAAAPSASIDSPASGGTYTVAQPVATGFSCTEGAGGPGITSCADSNGGSGTAGQLDTSTTGSHTYTVSADSADGQTGSASISYTVVPAPPITTTPGITATTATTTTTTAPPPTPTTTSMTTTSTTAAPTTTSTAPTSTPTTTTARPVGPIRFLGVEHSPDGLPVLALRFPADGRLLVSATARVGGRLRSFAHRFQVAAGRVVHVGADPNAWLRGLRSHRGGRLRMTVTITYTSGARTRRIVERRVVLRP